MYYYDADRYFDMKEAELMKRPKCDCCGEHIQDETCIEIDGKLYCHDCERENAADFWMDWCRDQFMRRVE